MTLAARFEPEAAQELDEAALWYEGRRPGLGAEFLDAIDRAVSMVQRWPQAAPLAIDAEGMSIRRAPVPHFPYRLIYLATPAAIRVLAVAHESKRPTYWLHRAR